MTKAKHPMQPIVVDERGNYRFKKNAIVEFLLDHGGFDMNDLAVRPFSKEDRAQFAQLIGYSVSGYSELPYVPFDIRDEADAIVARILAEKAGK